MYEVLCHSSNKHVIIIISFLHQTERFEKQGYIPFLCKSPMPRILPSMYKELSNFFPNERRRELG